MTELPWKGGTDDERDRVGTIFALMRQPDLDGLERLASATAPPDDAPGDDDGTAA